MTADRRFVRVDDGVVEWRCLSCAHWTAFADNECTRCGAKRGQLAVLADPPLVDDVPASDDRGQDRRPVRSAMSVILSMIGPGLGHLLWGKRTAGAARFVIFAGWVTAGWLWTWGDLEDVRLAGVVLLGGSVVLWGATLVDTIAMVRGRTEPFGSRGLLWLVVGVTVMLVAVVLAVIMGMAPL
ncbi:MAG: hypothetical protein WD007_00590 [Nitriliruptoraceae bacterium]